MSSPLNLRLFNELDKLVLIDPHTHINPLKPASETLADILGYHYYTELAHSAGVPRERIEEPGLSPKEKVGRIFEGISRIDNTVQWSWMFELSRRLFGFQGESIDPSNWEPLYDLALTKMAQPDWAEQVLKQSNIEAVFLTNDFVVTGSGGNVNADKHIFIITSVYFLGQAKMPADGLRHIVWLFEL